MFMKDGDDILKMYSLGILPHYVIVGKNGTVRYLKDCSNVEETV
jgi:hypothetical protein